MRQKALTPHMLSSHENTKLYVYCFYMIDVHTMTCNSSVPFLWCHFFRCQNGNYVSLIPLLRK